jgi:integrase
VAKKLTDIGIRNLRPSPARREIPDGNGLYVVVQPSGRKGFAVRYRFNGTPRKLTLPAGLTLAAARRLAADAVYQVAQGIDPAGAKKVAKIEAAEATANTIAAICTAYLKREGGKLRTSDQRERIFRRLIYPAIGERQIGAIKRSDLIHMLDRIEDKSGPRMADVTLAVLRRVFTWHALRTDDFSSPIVRGMGDRRPAKEARRSRILTDDELRAIWTATAAADNEPFAALVRLLLLTSARRGELAAMRWHEIDAEGVWTLPAIRNKTKIELARPLSKAALAMLDEQPRIVDCDFVFTSNGITAITSFSAPKEKLDAASGVTGWTVHDLRRSARSLMSRAGINADVAERCLGHAIPGVRGVYDRHKYLDEMRHAFEALAAQIERIVNPPEGDVIPLRQRR